jgi:hypothetical protein
MTGIKRSLIRAVLTRPQRSGFSDIRNPCYNRSGRVRRRRWSPNSGFRLKTAADAPYRTSSIVPGYCGPGAEEKQ